ncbi:hypothetical protein [Maribacter hydrothermalis]|uniref:RND transporter n=1 Tax=Maribacter hydrothermalis TaxID=1836467 RepID=A0A1B7ZBC5_9FLAO|nr:hypothetical protein [Maribacter hydrothermalis]APQ16447.1 hypothetical protein BTR34_03460 [Maribacter hydrothermalis]OBR40011.1 hypothetical protein A9200_17060 [Maribacter hydrothermalis]
MKEFINNWKLTLLLCLTIGMAPFFPEPHIWGKLKWILGGGKGMQFMDWFDVLLHGFPFILLIRIILIKLFKNKNH